MAEAIKNGVGNGDLAKVDNSNRLCVRSVVDSTFQESLSFGRAFVISSGIVNLTNAAASGILYIKNNENRDMLLSKLNIFIGNSTGGTAVTNFVITSTINPTGGTLISAASSVTPANLNFGASSSISMDSFKGVQGSTVSGGIAVSDIQPDSGRFPLIDVAILPKGFSIAISITPKTSNTNLDVIVTFAIELIEER